MNVSLCSSSFEFTTPFLKGMRCNNMDFLVDKSCVKIGNITKKDQNQVPNYDGKKILMSSNLISGHLEGSHTGRKMLEEATRKMDFVRTLLIDNYDSYTYNILQELSVINGHPPTVVRNDDWTWKEAFHYLYEERAFDNIVISPGPGSPTCPADIGICLQLLLECRDIPILGICLGHQALGYVHGAQVVHANEPIHGRLSELEHSGCHLFHNVPSGRNSGFKVVRYHSLVIDAESLPNQLIPIAWTSSDDTFPFIDTPKSETLPDVYMNQISKTSVNSFSENSINGNSCFSSDSKVTESEKVLMGIMHSTMPHYGVQFHPESVATRHGRQIFKNFRDITVDYWRKFRLPLRNDRKVNSTDPMFRELSRSTKLPRNVDERSCIGLENFLNTSHSPHKFLKLKWKKLTHLASQIGGTETIFCKLFGHLKAQNTFLLDSSSIEKKRARFSFMGGKGGSLWKQLTFRLSEERSHTSGGGYLSIEDAQSSTKSIFLKDGFLDYLDKELLCYRYEETDFEGLPFNFYGGYIGYLGYSLKVECGATSNRYKSAAPDACFFFADNVVVIDHWNDDIYLLSLNDGLTNRSSWLDDTESKLLNLKSSFLEKRNGKNSRNVKSTRSESNFLADITKEEYIKNVNKCLSLIKDGESYELCLTTQMRKKIGDGMDILGLYLDLRRKNPSPYGAWLNFATENLCICCSSPERFLRLDRNGVLEAKPIKGTIARGATIEEDDKLKLQLQHSEKDQAENLMIVDLLRNDLGRVCEPGSVHVPNLMEVESYATVHTMVSTIQGQKRANMSPINCVRAAFPGGSMTGAPKLRSMELLDSIETCSRGIYSGCIGYFSYNKTFDLNIVIRTIVIHDGEASIGAGGAVVALSEPEHEYNEMVLKTRVPVKVVMDH